MAACSSLLPSILILISLSSTIAFHLGPIRLIGGETETKTDTINPGRKVGGRSQVPNVESDKKVQDLGRFSVEEYNRRNNGEHLNFCKVIQAQRQVVSGLKYYLQIVIKVERGHERVFDAVVVVKPWLGSRLLVSFAPSASK